MTWTPDGPQGREAQKILHLIPWYTRGRGLDIGCGTLKALPHMIGVDSGHHWGEHTDVDVWSEADDLSMFADGSMDFCFSSHTLEHLVDPLKALRAWWRVIRTGGHLILYLPDKRHYPNIGQPGANPDHRSDFLPEDIIGLMRSVAGKADGWTLLENEERCGGIEYSFFQCYRKRADGQMVEQLFERNPGGRKRAIVHRFGAIGDHVIASSILPQLKAQGYHVTYNTIPLGEELLRHDPNIDEFLVQDKDQVPNEALGRFFPGFKERYDKIVNLCESMEGSLLQMPGRIGHSLPPSVRHKLFNQNYHERLHDIAEVPHVFRNRFYPTDREVADARRVREKIAPAPKNLVMLSLSGSAIHKTYPHSHAVVSWLLVHTDATVVTVGDKREQLLEEVIGQMLLADRTVLGGKALPPEETGAMKMSQLIKLVDERYGAGRWLPRAGAWAIRESMVMAQHCDVVAGPETGILNCVGSEPDVAKVIWLSHSSEENLCKHWVNYTALRAPDGTCPNAVVACHQMHYGSAFCPQHDGGGALCAYAIKPQDVFESIVRHLRAKLAA